MERNLVGGYSDQNTDKACAGKVGVEVGHDISWLDGPLLHAPVGMTRKKISNGMNTLATTVTAIIRTPSDSAVAVVRALRHSNVCVVIGSSNNWKWSGRVSAGLEVGRSRATSGGDPGTHE